MTAITDPITKHLVAFLCFLDRTRADEGMRILQDLGYRFIEHPECIDECDDNTTFIEAWKPLPAETEWLYTESDAVDEVANAIGHLGDTCGAGIADADEKVVWGEGITPQIRVDA
jgi:hypothetical protein